MKQEDVKVGMKVQLNGRLDKVVDLGGNLVFLKSGGCCSADRLTLRPERKTRQDPMAGLEWLGL